MNRKIVLSVFALLLSVLFAVSVSAVSAEGELEVLGVLGIMNGDENGNLNLDKTVTRAEFSKMTVMASPYKDSLPTASISSGFTDVEPTHWAAPYVRLAAENKWIYGYGNGSFLPSNNIKLEEAVTVILRVLGYTADDMKGVYPRAQLAIYESLELNENISAAQGDSITREDCAHLMYNLLKTKTKNGQSYAQTLGYSLDSNGEIDLLKIINDDLKGPFVVYSSYSALGLPKSGVSVKYNDVKSDTYDIKKYDVVYYSELTKTVSVYSRPVSGTIQAVSPNRDTPSQITVAGKSYNINGVEVARLVSNLGKFKEGDLVTLLLGRNDEVAAILPTTEYASDAYGVVLGIAQKVHTDENGRSYSARTVDVMLTSGSTVSLASNKTGFVEGDIVRLSCTDTVEIFPVQERKILHPCVVDGENIGDYTAAPGIRVLELGYEENNPAPLFFSRLTGAKLETRDVKHYVTDSSGRITDLILGDFSGDACDFGIMLEFTDASVYVSEDEDFDYSDVRITNYVYDYQIGTKRTMITSLAGYNFFGEGPCVFQYDNGVLDSIKTLVKLKEVEELASFGAITADGVCLYSDKVTVYVPSTDRKSELDYDIIPLTKLLENKEDYEISAYMDKKPEDGGRIRLMIARVAPVGKRA